MATKEGLEGVVAASSSICIVDGTAGKLYYRGYSIDDLAAAATFEEVAYLLWFGELPNRTQLTELKQQLAASRELPAPALDIMSWLPREDPRGLKTHPLDVLRSFDSMLALFDPDREDISEEANLRKSYRLTGQTITALAAWHRTRNGRRIVSPRPDLDAGANFLYMLYGEEPDPVSARTMDVALVLHAEHELNASTFAARVAAATLADMHSCITAAFAALKGPRHGGANEDVIEMLLEIGEPEKAAAWVKNRLARKKTGGEYRIPGFGHRVYKTLDPRAVHLRQMAEQLAAQTGNTKWLEIQQRVAETVRQETGLQANVDYYSATTYYALGIPTDLYTSIFGMARMLGWTAHVMEQYGGRLIRPRAEYVGPAPREFVPMERR